MVINNHKRVRHVKKYKIFTRTKKAPRKKKSTHGIVNALAAAADLLAMKVGVKCVGVLCVVAAP